MSASPKDLLDAEDRWITEMGAWFPGERVVYRGRDLLDEFNGKSWFALFTYGITGREFTEAQIKLFEGLWLLSGSFPEPRLWNNRIMALAGTARSSCALAIGAATAVSEAKVYGRVAETRAYDFLVRAQRARDSGRNLAEFVDNEFAERRILPGFGRPLTRRDERIEPILRLARELERADGPYTRLAFEIDALLKRRRLRFGMNAAALIAALCADQGLSRMEFYYMAVLAFSAGMLPCYIDTLAHEQGSFFPLRCSRVAYEGVPRRRW